MTDDEYRLCEQKAYRALKKIIDVYVPQLDAIYGYGDGHGGMVIDRITDALHKANNKQKVVT